MRTMKELDRLKATIRLLADRLDRFVCSLRPETVGEIGADGDTHQC